MITGGQYKFPVIGVAGYYSVAVIRKPVNPAFSGQPLKGYVF